MVEDKRERAVFVSGQLEFEYPSEWNVDHFDEKSAWFIDSDGNKIAQFVCPSNTIEFDGEHWEYAIQERAYSDDDISSGVRYRKGEPKGDGRPVGIIHYYVLFGEPECELMSWVGGDQEAVVDQFEDIYKSSRLIY